MQCDASRQREAVVGECVRAYAPRDARLKRKRWRRHEMTSLLLASRRTLAIGEKTYFLQPAVDVRVTLSRA